MLYYISKFAQICFLITDIIYLQKFSSILILDRMTLGSETQANSHPLLQKMLRKNWASIEEIINVFDPSEDDHIMLITIWLIWLLCYLPDVEGLQTLRNFWLSTLPLYVPHLKYRITILVFLAPTICIFFVMQTC